LGGRVGEVLAPVLGPLLRVPRLKLFVDRASVNSEQNPHLFFTEMLRDLNISYRPHPHSAAEQTSESIPSEGPVVVVANHPLGFADAMIMADFIAKQRTDYKILGNALLKHAVPEAVTEHLIAVDLWSGAGVREQQQRIMEESRRQLEQGVVIGIFPSGAASLPVETSSGRVILDEEWKTGVARMIA
jgi:putative hemolysin